MALTVVFDTNILFSATGWRGNPFQCVEHARAGRIHAVTCPELMQELAEKLETKLGFSPEQTTETLADYLSFLPSSPFRGGWMPCRAILMTTTCWNVRWKPAQAMS